MRKYLPHICILIAGITWGMIGLFNRYLLAGGFTPAAIVLTRNFGGLLLMTVLFFFMDRSIFRIRLRHIPYFLGTGVVSVVLFTLMYFSCQEQCSLAVAAILLYTAPAFVMLMSAILFRESITKKEASCSCGRLCGLCVCQRRVQRWFVCYDCGTSYGHRKRVFLRALLHFRTICSRPLSAVDGDILYLPLRWRRFPLCSVTLKGTRTAVRRSCHPRTGIRTGCCVHGSPLCSVHQGTCPCGEWQSIDPCQC